MALLIDSSSLWESLKLFITARWSEADILGVTVWIFDLNCAISLMTLLVIGSDGCSVICIRGCKEEIETWKEKCALLTSHGVNHSVNLPLRAWR